MAIERFPLDTTTRHSVLSVELSGTTLGPGDPVVLTVRPDLGGARQKRGQITTPQRSESTLGAIPSRRPKRSTLARCTV
jgi:hypothetical protein